MPEKYLSPKQISNLYGIPLGRIYWWINQGQITYTKKGRSVMIPQNEFQRDLENHTHRQITEEQINMEEME